jgi:hypothetical protein
MAGRRNKPSSKELEALADWSRTVLRFIAGMTPTPTKSRFLDYENVVDSALARGDLKGLRTIRRDCAEWAKGLPAEATVKLDALLRSRLGHGLTDEAKAELKEVQAILARGRIETEEEYLLLVGRADEIHANDRLKDELEAIGVLLWNNDVPKS